MRIETIRVRNFKASADLEIKNVPFFCVLVGANGTGKTTFFDVFGFLKDCLTSNVQTALIKRGGFQRVVTQGKSDSAIEIEIQFRLEIAGIKRLVTYRVEIALRKNKPYVRQELLRYKRGRYGSPYHFLDFKEGFGYAITNEEDFSRPDEDLTKEEQRLDSDTILAIKGLGQFQRFKAANAFRALIENWHVSDFYIDSTRGDKSATGYSEHLNPSGDNLANYAKYLKDNHPEKFDNIINKMKSRIPGLRSVESSETDDGRLILKFGDGAFNEPFIDRFVSDGTIKMFAYLALLNDPAPHPLLCVEEPENQLYPTLLAELAEEFRTYSAGDRQVFVSTHSPDFLNACLPSEVFWLGKSNGLTSIHSAQQNTQIKAYYDAGDKLGSLWTEGHFTGADPQ
jgi:predicted ATPase